MTTLEVGLDDDLLTLVSERAAAAAGARRLDDEVVARLAATGLNRSLVPVELGGAALHPLLVFDALERIGRVDGSVAWCSAISAGSNIFAGYVPEAVARVVWDDPDGGAAGMFSPTGVVSVRGEGAAVLTGRWAFTSNCLHSRRIGLGAWFESTEGERSPIPRLVIVPADDVEIEDTWFGSGLQATGSHHVVAHEVAIDPAASCSFGDRPWPDGPLWRIPLFAVLAPCLVAAPLGVARGAVDELLRRVRGGEGGATRGALQDDPVGLAELGEADAALRAARAGVADVLDRLWTEAEEGRRADRPLQAVTFLAVQHAMDAAVAATSTAHRLSGGAAAYAGHRVLTALRDVETARQHVMFSHQHRPAIARIAAGIDDVSPPFVI